MYVPKPSCVLLNNISDCEYKAKFHHKITAKRMDTSRIFCWSNCSRLWRQYISHTAVEPCSTKNARDRASFRSCGNDDGGGRCWRCSGRCRSGPTPGKAAASPWPSASDAAADLVPSCSCLSRFADLTRRDPIDWGACETGRDRGNRWGTGDPLRHRRQGCRPPPSRPSERDRTAQWLASFHGVLPEFFFEIHYTYRLVTVAILPVLFSLKRLYKYLKLSHYWIYHETVTNLFSICSIFLENT